MVKTFFANIKERHVQYQTFVMQYRLPRCGGSMRDRQKCFHALTTIQGTNWFFMLRCLRSSQTDSSCWRASGHPWASVAAPASAPTAPLWARGFVSRSSGIWTSSGVSSSSTRKTRDGSPDSHESNPGKHCRITLTLHSSRLKPWRGSCGRFQEGEPSVLNKSMI